VCSSDLPKTPKPQYIENIYSKIENIFCNIIDELKKSCFDEPEQLGK
jgi:hypothetical protein